MLFGLTLFVGKCIIISRYRGRPCDRRLDAGPISEKYVVTSSPLNQRHAEFES